MRFFSIICLVVSSLFFQIEINGANIDAGVTDVVVKINLEMSDSGKGEHHFFKEIGGSNRVFEQVVFAEGVIDRIESMPEGELLIYLKGNAEFYTTGLPFLSDMPPGTEVSPSGSVIRIQTQKNALIIKVKESLPLSIDRLPSFFVLKRNMDDILKAVKSNATVKLATVSALRYTFTNRGDLIIIEVNNIQILPVNSLN